MRSIGVRSIVRGDNVSNGQNDLYDGYLKAALLSCIAFHIIVVHDVGIIHYSLFERSVLYNT